VGIDLENDPVESGLVASLARPGGNFTGLFLDMPEMSGKLLQLLREVLPRATRMAVLWESPLATAQFRATEAAARAAGISLQSIPVEGAEDFGRAFRGATRERASAVILLSSPRVFFQRGQIAEFAMKNRLPTISLFTMFPAAGGLMAYGPNLADMYRRAGFYVGKILKGAKPADLPVERPTKFDLVINVKTAKALGLTIPESVLIRADHVIE
jgi:putative ABC transport system substrate-binding protein